MSEVIQVVRKGEYASVTLSHGFATVVPGQCVKVGDSYFAISDFTAGSVTLLVRAGSRLDIPRGSHVSLEGPIGKGFPGHDDPIATIAVAGTAAGVGVLLAEKRRYAGLKTHLIVITRGPTPVSSRVFDLSWGNSGGSIFHWCTTSQGSRPGPVLGTFLSRDEILEGSLFLAGPKDFVNTCRDEAKQLGVTDNNIRTNY